MHHGANEVYLDRNYGGILIIWDRIFGSFQGETERPRYVFRGPGWSPDGSGGGPRG